MKNYITNHHTMGNTVIWTCTPRSILIQINKQTIPTIMTIKLIVIKNKDSNLLLIFAKKNNEQASQNCWYFSIFTLRTWKINSSKHMSKKNCRFCPIYKSIHFSNLTIHFRFPRACVWQYVRVHVRMCMCMQACIGLTCIMSFEPFPIMYLAIWRFGNFEEVGPNIVK